MGRPELTEHNLTTINILFFAAKSQPRTTAKSQNPYETRLGRTLFFFGMVGFWAVDPQVVNKANHLVQAA